MFTIALDKLPFYAYHGFYPEENIIGNHFEVSLAVTFTEKHYIQEQLDTTVNYELLYKTIKVRMLGTPYKLLETLAQDILADGYQHFSFITSAQITIKKFHPLIGGNIGASVVTLNKTY